MTQGKLTNIKTNSQQAYFQNFYRETIEMHNQNYMYVVEVDSLDYYY